MPNSQKKKVGCIRIDGNTPAFSRQALVNDFQEKDAIKAAVVWLHFFHVIAYKFYVSCPLFFNVNQKFFIM